MYYIYRITNLVNGKTYIGKHKYEKREAYRKSGRKDWNTFQKEYKKEYRGEINNA